jgi:hypothetical protein
VWCFSTAKGKSTEMLMVKTLDVVLGWVGLGVVLCCVCDLLYAVRVVLCVVCHVQCVVCCMW